jgi:Rod binding domain-containing protein
MDVAQLLHKPISQPQKADACGDASALNQTEDEARCARQLRCSAVQFEQILMHQIIKQMNETVNYTSLDEDDDTGQQIQGMVGSFMADALGQKGGLGFWKIIYHDLARKQDLDTEQFPAEGNQLNEYR